MWWCWWWWLCWPTTKHRLYGIRFIDQKLIRVLESWPLNSIIPSWYSSLFVWSLENSDFHSTKEICHRSIFYQEIIIWILELNPSSQSSWNQISLGWIIMAVILLHYQLHNCSLHECFIFNWSEFLVNISSSQFCSKVSKHFSKFIHDAANSRCIRNCW
jgi:hypothetical protein